jgi:hypothetical protein
MNLEELAEAYGRIAGRHALPRVSPAHLRVSRQSLDNPQAAWTALQAVAPLEGWLQFQSIVQCFSGRALPKPEPDWGLLLAAEAVDGEGRSHLIRQDGSGGMVLVTCDPNADEGGETWLADEVEQLAAGKAPGRLRYRRYWRRDPEMGLAPALAAFIGFARA